MQRDDLGFLSSPENGLGIVRARTILGNLRFWDIPRLEQALATMIKEIGKSPIPGLYLLVDERSEKKMYVGQTEDLESRLTTHMKTPEEKIKNWQRALIFNDGRNASQSDLNDENIRLTLENYLVRLCKLNHYRVVTSATRSPSLSAQQITFVKAFEKEINILLSNKGRVSRFISGRQDDEIYLDEVKKVLIRGGYKVNNWGEKYATINDEVAVIRPGSLKPKGWQVTFRGSKSLAQLKNGQGYLLMPRGKIVLLPLKEIAAFVHTADSQAFDRDTVDIFIRFDEDKLALVYKGQEKDITAYSVEPYLG